MDTFYIKLQVPALLLVGLFGTALMPGGIPNPETPSTAESADHHKTLRHVVFFSFNDDASAATVKDIGHALIALEGSIDVIRSLEWGTSIAEGQDYSHCLLVNFASEEDLGTYLPHPAHQKFLSDYSKYFEKVAVADFWVTE